MTFSESANISATFFTKYSFFLKMEQFTYIYKQGALCGTARAARTIGPRPPAGYGYPEKTAGVPCRRRACPRSSHPARPPPPPNHPACPSRDERLLRSGQILEKTRPVVLRLIWAFRPLHTTDCKQRSGRPHPPGTPTRNRAVPRRGNRKQQTERRQWQQRSSEGGRSVVCIRNGVKIIPPAEKRSFFLIFAP